MPPRKKRTSSNSGSSNNTTTTNRRVTRSSTTTGSSKTKNKTKKEPVVEVDGSPQPIEVIEIEESPRTELTLVDCLLDNLDETGKFGHYVQFGVFLFLFNLVYLYIEDDAEAKSRLYTILFSSVGVLAVLGIVFNNKVNTYRLSENLPYEDKMKVQKPQLPEFGLVYALFCPLLIVFLKSPTDMPLIVGCVTQMSGMATVVKVVVAIVTSFQLSMETTQALPTHLFGAAVLHAFFFECIEQFASNSLSFTEKQLFATGFIALNFLTTGASPEPIQILQKLSISFAVAAIVCVPIYNVLSATKKSETPNLIKEYSLSCLIHVVFLTVGIFVSVRSLTPVLDIDPFTWLADFVSGNIERVTIFKYWLLSSFVLIPLFFFIAPRFFPLDVRRKLWHFVIFAELAYPILVEPKLVSLALIFLIGMFIFIEFQRSLRLKPFGDFFASVFEPFEDSKDKKGPLVLSYIFLVLGISVPVFLNGCSGRQSSIAGLVSLGLGDSAASLIGKRMGAHKWPETKKSIEGSIAFFLFTALGIYGFKIYGQNDYSDSKIIVTALLVAVVEGITELNDNLIAPLMTYVALETIKN